MSLNNTTIPSLTDKSIANERNIMREAFLKTCLEYPAFANFPEEKQFAIIRKIERGCFNIVTIQCECEYINRYWSEKKFIDRYSAQCYLILSNLDIKVNECLIKKICDGSLAPSRVGACTSYDMCPQASQAERTIIAQRQQQKINEKYSDKHTCRVCHAKKTIYYEVQTRSLDEPSTQRFECIECGHTW